MLLKRLILIFAFLALYSCSTFKNIEIGLTRATGRSINSLISRIGYPTDERIIAGRKLYIWDTRRLVGWDGNIIDLYCKITVEVDSNDKIIYWTYSGNRGGCRSYSDALKIRNKSREN